MNDSETEFSSLGLWSMISHQEKSEIFWKKAQDSHLASPVFYEMKRKYLSVLINNLPGMKAGLDIGCGNGEYTSMLLQKAEMVVGYDLSPGLLEVARRNYAANPRIRFLQAAVDEIPEPEDAFDVVLCMGVTSCIIDEAKYIDLIKKIGRYVSNNSYVIMGDTLSNSQSLLLDEPTGYVAMYRDADYYRNNLISQGLELITEVKIIESHGGKTANKLFLFSKP